MSNRAGKKLYPGITKVPDDQVAADCWAVMRGLRQFTESFWDILNPSEPFKGGYVMDCICEHYEEWLRPGGCIQNLIVNQPFRTGKSTLLVYAMCYQWVKDSSKAWMFATYDHSLSLRDSRRCRKVIAHPRYQAVLEAMHKQFSILKDQNTQRQFTNDREGFRMALTVGKGLGEGADFLVVDDPIDPAKGRSPVMREACIDWWRSTYRHRFRNPDQIRRLVVQQRVTQGDLTGYLLENEADEFQHLCLTMRYEPERIIFPPLAPGPAGLDVVAAASGRIAERATTATGEAPTKARITDPIRPTALQLKRPNLQDNAGGSGRACKGDLLWPERFNEEKTRELERTLMNEAAGQLQQRPSSATGTVFRVDQGGDAVAHFSETGLLIAIITENYEGKRVSIAADRWRFFQVMDTASTAKNESSYTVVGTFALSDDGMLVLWNIFREKLEVPDLFPTIKKLKTGECRWDDGKRTAVLKPDGYWPSPLLARYVEPKSSGIGLIQESVIDGNPLAALPKVPGDKVQRASHAASYYQAGTIFHRKGPWLTDSLEELRLFPNARNDDVADVVSYACYVAANEKLLRTHINRRVVLNTSSRPAATQAEIDRLTR